jgi:hypothetical protein
MWKKIAKLFQGPKTTKTKAKRQRAAKKKVKARPKRKGVMSKTRARRTAGKRKPPTRPTKGRRKRHLGKPGARRRVRPAPSLKKRAGVIDVGRITHYFPKVKAAVLHLQKPIAVGESIIVEGATTAFRQTITSMQIDRSPITQAKPGDEIGLEVRQRVRVGDRVLKIKV